MRCKGGKFGCTPSRESVSVSKHGTSWNFDFPASNTMPAQKGPGTAKPKLCRFSQFLVALFRIFGKATSFRRSENSPSGPVVVALFRIKGKENYRGLRLETLFHRATV